MRFGIYTISTDRVRATVSTVAGMLLDAAFELDGREIRPFARAPWIGEPGLEALPGHMRELGAEFVAVPFGSVGAPEGIAADWAPLVPADGPAVEHGISADAEWSVVTVGPADITLAIDYPEHEGISRLERTISLRPDATAIDFELVLTARRTVSTAIGLHPILRLPERPGALTLSMDFERGFTYPGTVWPGAGPTLPNRTFDALDRVPAKAGGDVDLSRLPLVDPTEDVWLLAGAAGPLLARFGDEGVEVTLDWDRGILPSMLMWLSDRALVDEPWRGRYRGLGVEPIAAAFDFPGEVSAHSNPLTDAGYPTAVTVRPGTPLSIRYSIEVSSI